MIGRLAAALRGGRCSKGGRGKGYRRKATVVLGGGMKGDGLADVEEQRIGIDRPEVMSHRGQISGGTGIETGVREEQSRCEDLLLSLR